MTAEEKSIQSQYNHGPINIPKQMWFYLWFSLLITIPGLIVMGMSMMHYPNHSPLRLGIDFTGGTMLQYGFEKSLTQDDIQKMRLLLGKADVSNPIIQLQQAQPGMTGLSGNITTEAIKPDGEESSGTPAEKVGTANNKKSPSVTELFKDTDKPTAASSAAKTTQIRSVVSIRAQDLSTEQTVTLQKMLKDEFGNYVGLQKNRVGPTLASELFRNAAIGLLIAYATIVVYLAVRFQLDYAVTAIVALVHDTIFMLGAFSILGWYFGVEVDSMFVTAILTVVGFSVHDTIVVFDRIRENSRVLYTKKLPFGEVVNISVNQTLARSINTSLTALLTLLALYFFGGESTQNFVLAMILGIIVGTYSSIFVASSLLTWWRIRKSSPASAAGSSGARTQAI